MKKTSKRALSLFLTLIMLMSCFSSVLPIVASALPATDTTYTTGGAYGTPAWTGQGDRWFQWGNGDNYVKVYYPSHMYLDKSETLQRAGYHMDVEWHFGDSEDYRILLGAPVWGDYRAHSGMPDKYYTMTNIFSDYSVDASILQNGKQIVYGGTGSDATTFDLRIVGYGHANQGEDGFNANGIRHDKYILWRNNGNESDPRKTTIYLMGTPGYTVNAAEFNTAGNSVKSYGIAQNWNGCDAFVEHGTSKDFFNQKGHSSSYTQDGYIEMQWFVTVYDKSALDTAINNANSNYLSYTSRYTSDSYNALQTAVNNAKAVLTKRATTQTEINNAIDAINEAIKELCTMVYFNANGGTITGAASTPLTIGSQNPTWTYVGDYSMFSATREGYTFKGWSTSATTSPSDTANYFPENGTSISGTFYQTFYAVWEANKYTVTWLNEDGSTYQTQQVAYGSAIPTIAVPAKEGHSGSWDYAGHTTVPVNGLTIKPVYTINKYTVTWKNDDGTVLETDKDVPYGTTPTYNSAEPTKASTTQYRYEFAGWDKTLTPVTGDVTYTATFTAIPNAHTETYKNWDGSVLATYTDIPYGQTAEYKGDTPTKTADAQYTYTFSGWKSETDANGNVTYTAQYSTTTNTYTVEWVVNDQVVETDTVEYGKMPEYNGTTPTKAPNAQYSYTFDKWSPAIAAVTGHARYEATFTATLNKYTVNWVVDNEIYHTEQVEYGTKPTLPATPTKAADAQYTYTFKEWTPTVTAVMNDTNYTAVFDKTVNKYTVTWVDEDGTTELYSAEFEYGATPVYGAEEPTKAATAQYTYTFAGWDRAYETVKADATYTATYSSTVNKYTIKFVNHDGTELQSSEVEYGTKPVYTGAEPTKAKDAQYTYVFTGWDPEIAEVTEAATYTAQFEPTINVYTVTWVNYDGTELEVDENVPYGTTPEYNGATPTKPQTDKYNYTFADKWSPEVNEVTGDVTYTAQFNETVRKYTITWVVNGTPVKTDEVEYDTVPVYTGATPEKAADAQYTYTFKDWSPAVVAVTGPATYVAEFNETVNTYTVTWVNDDDTVLETDENVPYGATPSYDSATPTKAKDAQYTYTFDKWTPEISTVEGNITYKATYTTTTNKYTVTWKNENGAVLETDVGVEYGKMPTFDQANPTKAATAQYSYTFAGWTPEVSTVTGDVTYTAKYDSTVNEYTITWIVEGEKTTTTVKYGETPAYSGTPKKAQTPEFTYEFAGWDPAVVSVTGEATYTATFTPITRSYKVTWVDENGTTELYTETLLVGATIPNKEVPYKDGFIGVWGTYPATMPTNDLTIKAEYFEDGIKVNWVIDDTTTYQTAVRQGYQITPDSAWETKAPTVSTVYTFKGWSETKGGAIVTTFPTVTADDTEDKTYYAVFEESARKYTIRFVNEGGAELQSGEVAYGETPAYTGATPTKAATAQYTYTHSGWTPAVVAVTGDATYTATYTATVNEYTITWKNADGTELKSESVAYGETPEYTGEDPVKEGDAQYSYVFTGWTPAIADVTEDATYTANFAQVVNEYTVTWVVEGVTVETDENVPYGTVPTFNGSTPTKTADAQYTYTFASWDPTVSAITGDTTYNAKFDKTVNKYTVTWANDDGSEIYSEEVEYGKTPEYTGDEPTKAATAQYTYAFDGWDKEITAVEGDVTYTATYSSTVNKYTVTWVVEGETVEIDENVEYGTMASYDGAEPTKAGNAQYSYTFDKWTPEISEVTGDVTYTATFTQSVNKYTITWIVNGVETTEQVEYGTVPTFTGSTDKAPDNTTVYTFAGWDNEVVAVTGDATYTATYSEADRLYTITWIVDGNTTTEQYKYNEVPSFKGSTDKAPTEGASYVFKGWNKEIANVTADATYTAEYDVTVRMFTITWIVDGQEIKQQWAYGTVPAFDGSTDKAPSATTTYTFAGWDKTPVEVKSDATYTATYTESVRKYTVVWYVDGEFFATQDVAYNTVIPTPGLPADKEGYTVRWDNSVTIMPAGDVEIHAIYTPRMYPVYWMVDGLTVYSASVAFGNTIPTMTVPAKEGYTGKWVNIPATMPAGIVTISAEYTPRTYTVSWRIDGAQGSGTATYGQEYRVTFDVGTIPEELRITVGGAAIDENSYSYDSIAGTLIIYGPAITGNISIVAKSTSGNVNVTNSIFGGSSSNTNNVIEMRKTYHTTITPAAGYLLPKTVAIYVDGIYVTSGYSYDPVTGKLTINAEVIVGELEIYAECLEDPNYDSSTDNDNNINTDGCSCNCHSKNAFIKFFFDIFNFLRKLFGMEKYHYCECGAAHW